MRVGWKQLALLAGTAAVALTACEVLVRVIGLAPGFGAVREGQQRPTPDPELMWENTPGALDHNDLGLRGSPPEEPRTRPRVLLLGDSVAYGFGLALEDTIPVQLASELGQLGAGVEVLNGGVCGYDTVQASRWLETRGAALHPDQVVLLYCLNDTIRSTGVDERVVRDAMRFGQTDAWLQARAAQRLPGAARWLLERFHLPRLLLGLIQDEQLDARGNPANVVDLLAGKDLSVVRLGFERLADWSRRTGCPITLAVVPWIRAVNEHYGFDAHHRAVAALAAEYGLATVDLLEPVRRARRESGADLHLPGDPIHPDPTGARVIARALARFLSPLAPVR